MNNYLLIIQEEDSIIKLFKFKAENIKEACQIAFDSTKLDNEVELRNWPIDDEELHDYLDGDINPCVEELKFIASRHPELVLEAEEYFRIKISPLDFFGVVEGREAVARDLYDKIKYFEDKEDWVSDLADLCGNCDEGHNPLHVLVENSERAYPPHFQPTIIGKEDEDERTDSKGIE